MAIPSELPEVPTSETENLSASFQPPDNLDELFKYQSWFEGTSHFAMEERYGYRNDGMAYGRYEFDNSSNKLSFLRSEVTGPCSDASQAPECPFTWGSAGTDKYWGASPTFYGFNQKIVKSFSKLRQIKAQITLRLLTGNMNGAGANGFAACNLVLGFGESDQDNPDNPNLPLDLNIGNRNSFKDLIHFSYQIFQDGADRLNIENRINVGVDPSFPANAIYEGDFNLTGNDPLVANNDFITYQIQINFVHESEQALVTLTPLDSNKNVESMEKQEIIWDYFSDINRVDNSEPRAGVAVDLDGAEPLSRDEFLNSDVVVGFGSNGVVKECSVEGLSVEWDLK